MRSECPFKHDQSDAGDALRMRYGESRIRLQSPCWRASWHRNKDHLNRFCLISFVFLTSYPGRWSTRRRPRTALRRAPPPSSAPPVCFVFGSQISTDRVHQHRGSSPSLPLPPPPLSSTGSPLRGRRHDATHDDLLHAHISVRISIISRIVQKPWRVHIKL